MRLILMRMRKIARGCFITSRRYAPALATEPGQMATVLVALAMMAGTPVKINAGNVKKLPPPATEFIVPPIIAATKRSRYDKTMPRKTSIKLVERLYVEYTTA